MIVKQKEHQVWLDVLRIIAISLMVLAHACDPYVGQFETSKSAFLSGVLTGSFTRACVPLFVMITGVLLLPVNMRMKEFYKKRIGRIIRPLVFWSVVTPLLFHSYFTYIYPNTLNPAIDLANHTLSASVSKILLSVINFNYDTIPLWYLYMLIGLYMVIPIFAVWAEQATKREFKLFLSLWTASLFLPYVVILAPLLGYQGNYGSMAILGKSFWNDYGTFYYFSGFIGYILLGHYLTKYPLSWSLKKTMLIGIPTFLLGYTITSAGFLMMQEYFPGNYQYLEIIWYFTGVNVAMMVIPVFLIVQKMSIKPFPLLKKAASLMFGVYLVHFILIQAAYDVVVQTPIHPFLQIVSIGLLAFISSYAIAWLLQQWSVTRRFIS